MRDGAAWGRIGIGIGIRRGIGIRIGIRRGIGIRIGLRRGIGIRRGLIHAVSRLVQGPVSCGLVTMASNVAWSTYCGVYAPPAAVIWP